jgi:hypothetical protein
VRSHGCRPCWSRPSRYGWTVPSGHSGWLDWHERNAHLIFILTLTQLLVAVVVWRRSGPAWPIAASGLLVVVILLQTGLGYARQLAFHVPLGVALFGLTIWLLVGLAHGNRSR